MLKMSSILWPIRRRKEALSTRQLRYQLHSDQGRAKCPTVPQRRELVTDERAAGQGSK